MIYTLILPTLFCHYITLVFDTEFNRQPIFSNFHTPLINMSIFWTSVLFLFRRFWRMDIYDNFQSRFEPAISVFLGILTRLPRNLRNINFIDKVATGQAGRHNHRVDISWDFFPYSSLHASLGTIFFYISSFQMSICGIGNDFFTNVEEDWHPADLRDTILFLVVTDVLDSAFTETGGESLWWSSDVVDSV